MHVCLHTFIYKKSNMCIDMCRAKNDDVDDALYSLPSITNP